MPKRCGHFDGHALVDTAEMQAKVAAAVATRDDHGLVVIARTDARGVLGLDEALRRGHAYLDAGADALFVEAPQSPEELERIGREFAGVPLVANVVEGGKTPPLSVKELHDLGFTIVLYANFLMRAMLHAGQQALAHLADSGETASYTERLLPWQDRQELFGLAEYGAVEDHFLGAWGTP
jgi:2,3-dimethylmalate lyase